MMKIPKNAILVTVLTLGAAYFLYEELRKHFTPSLQTSKDVDLALDEPVEGHIGRKLSSIDLNGNKESLEFTPNFNPFDKELNSEEKNKENSKSLISYKKFGRNRMKKLSRRKRSAKLQKDLGWKLSLNVNNNQNSPKFSETSNVDSKDGLLSKSDKESFMKLAIQMEGSSSDNSFKELHQAWSSLGLFLKGVYGKKASLKENASDITVEINTETSNFLPADTFTESSERDRAPKFLLGLLNFGSSKSPLEGVGTTLGNGNPSESVTSAKTNAASNEEQISTKVPLRANDTDASSEAFGLPEPISVEPKMALNTEAFSKFESASSEKLEKTSSSADDSPFKVTTRKPQPSFTSDQLKEFCISLLGRIHVSPNSADHFSEEDGSGEISAMNKEDKETVTGFQSLSTDVPKEVTTKLSNQRFGAWASIWNRFVGRRLVQQSIDDSLQPSSLAPKDITFEKAKDSSTDAFNLKAESSTSLGNSEATESDFFSDEDESALNVPDCESFFRQMQNDAVFSKPNLLDIINNPLLLSLDPSHFNLTEIRDEQIRSMGEGSHSTDFNLEGGFPFTEKMIDSITTPLSIAESSDKEREFSVNELLSEDQDQKLIEITVSNKDPLPTLSIDAQESFDGGTLDNSNIDNMVTENEKESRKSADETPLISDTFTTKLIQSSTGISDGGLFIKSEVNARIDRFSEIPSLEVSSDINHRIFGIFDFGSGERSIDGSESFRRQDVSEFTENPLHTDQINFASNDSELKEAFTVNGLETVSTDSVTGTNIFDTILGLRKEETQISTESDAFDINEMSLPTERTISSTEKPLVEFQKEKFNESKLKEAFTVNGLETVSTDSATRPNIFDGILGLQKEESLISTESDVFDINERRLSTEGESAISSIEKPLVELQKETFNKSELSEAFTVNGLETVSTDSATRPNIFDAILGLQKEESLISTESDVFDINERSLPTEGESAISSTAKPLVEFQFDPEEKLTEGQNDIDLTNKLTTPLIPDRTQFNERQSIELQFDQEEKSTETQNIVLGTANIPLTKTLSEDHIPIHNILDGSDDEGSRIFPGLLSIFGSGDGRELSENTTDQNINSEFSDCLDCSKKNSSSFSIDDCINCGSDSNDAVFLIDKKISTTIKPLSKNFESNASVGNEDYDDLTDADAFSESNQDTSEFSTVHSLKSFISSPAAVTVNYDDFDDRGSDVNNSVPLTDHRISTAINLLSNNIVSDASVDETHLDNKSNKFSKPNHDFTEFTTVPSLKSLISSPAAETINYEHYDNLENIGYQLTNYDHYDDSENIGYQVTNYDRYENSGNIRYQVTNYDHYGDSENIGYQVPNYEHYDNAENIGYNMPTLEHVHIEDECNESHSAIKTEAFASSTGVPTVPGDLRFLDTLFLTGSGEGGLFGNDNGEINLVQEPDTTSFPFQTPISRRQSRRGGRMDDLSFATWPTDKEERISDKQSDFIQPFRASDIPNLNSHDASIDKTLQKPEGNKFNPDGVLPSTAPGFIQSTKDSFNNPKNIEDATHTFQNGFTETVTSIRPLTNSLLVITKKKVKNLPLRYCNHAGECNTTLNEGCVIKEDRGVCDCRRSFVRHPETNICEALFMLNTSLKLPGEVFHEDLRDEYSELYKNKTRDAIDTMWLVVYQDPTLENNIADINIAGFEEGSLVVHWELIFAVRKNESVLETVQKIDEKLKETFNSEVVVKSAPLHIENAQFLSVSRDIDPCANKDLNYCSKDAECIRDERRGFFRCRCKVGYLDNSKNLMYPGETCIATCPQDYCGENGYCEMRSNGKIQCFCNGWYFGQKCTLSGTLAISSFAGANVLLIVVVLVFVFFCKRRRQRRARFHENIQVGLQPSQEVGRVSPRLAASIALDNMGPTKPSKYMAINTPYYIKPDIHVTSPSVIGSSFSYDCDSTFDRTPSAEVSMEPTKEDSVPVNIDPPKYDSVPAV